MAKKRRRNLDALYVQPEAYVISQLISTKMAASLFICNTLVIFYFKFHETFQEVLEGSFYHYSHFLLLRIPWKFFSTYCYYWLCPIVLLINSQQWYQRFFLKKLFVTGTCLLQISNYSYILCKYIYKWKIRNVNYNYIISIKHK